MKKKRIKLNRTLLIIFIICLFFSPKIFTQNLNIPAGSTLRLNTGKLNLPGNLDIAGNLEITTGSISITGNWNCTGNFSCGTSSVKLCGISGQIILTSGDSFSDLLITNHSAGGVSFQDGFSTQDFTAVTPGTNLKFMQNETFTINNELTMHGLQGNEIILDSINGVNRFTLNITKGPETASEVNVSNSQTIGNSITATNSIEGANTDFGEGVPTWIFAAVIRYWVGPVAGNWLDNANWSTSSGGFGGFSIPATEDTAIFDAGSVGGGPQLETDVEITDVKLETGYTGKFLSNIHDVEILGELVVKAGEFVMENSTGLTVEGNVSISGGELNTRDSSANFEKDILLSSGQYVAPSGILEFGGSLLNTGGQFVHSGGSVNLIGAGITVISGNNNFNDLVCMVPGKTIKFGAGDTQSIGGTFDFRGINANPVILRSTLEGSQWNVSLTSGNQKVSYLDVKDSKALVNEVRTYNSRDSGNNNENWIFAGAIAIVTPYSNRTVDNIITFRGTAGPEDTVIIKTPGGVTVATIKADSNGNFRGNSDPDLVAGVYDFVPWVGTISGDGVTAITVIDSPTTAQVPEIVIPEENARIVGGEPVVRGNGKPGALVTLTAKDTDGNLLLTDVAAAMVDSSGNFNIKLIDYYESLVRGTNYLTVTIDGVTSDVVGINLIDPYGIVFDSVTNDPIEGATVTLVTSDGTVCVPGVHIAAADKNPQITKSDGFYEYMVAPGDYYIKINSEGHSYPSNKTSFSSGRTIVTGSKGEMFSVIAAIIEMDHPVDMSPFLKIEKTVNRRELTIGDIATYTVTIENTSSTGDNAHDAVNIRIKDIIPPGFKYIPGRSRLENTELIDPDGPRPLYFDVGNIVAGQKKELKYQLVVGTGVIPGDYKNTAVAIAGDDLIVSNTAVRNIRVIHDSLFHMGTVIGKVYNDRNKNGYQDKGEPTIGGATLVTEEGTVIKTGKNGKYHLPALLPGRHVIRLDERSLPAGAYTTTPSTVIVDITNGILKKVNFGVGLIKDGENMPVTIRLINELPEKRLNVVLLSGGIEYVENKILSALEFRIFTNYSLFIRKWKLDIQPEGMSMIVKSFNGTGLNIHSPLSWNGLDKWGNPLRPEFKYSYRIKVWGHGKETSDITIGKLFNVTVFSENKKLDPEIAQRVFKNEVLTDNIDKNMSNIKVNGSLMKIGDISLTSGNLIVYRGKSKVGKLKVDKNNQSLLQESGIEMILPAGRYMIEADGVTENIDSKITTTEKLLYTQELNVIKDDFIFVAMFDAEMGHNTFEGNIEPIQHDRRYRDKYWKDGRAAFYLKGKIKGKYLVTSSYDSERSRRDLFRKLDPDTYYPVYGDYSSTSYDATNTQGKLYFMVEWDKSKALFGNFSADLSGSKLAPYSKSFYGGKLDYQSVATSPWGDPLTRIVIYKATQNQRSAHNEFLATGGSLYFLKHRNLINGSLRISIEVRDKLTGLVITKKSQTEGMDFNVDYGNGRILFFQPVRSRVMSNILTTNQLLDGNPVYVIAEYEFDDLYTFKEGSVGGRIEQGVGEYVNVGGSYVKEEQGNRDYELKEADATVRFGKLASIRGEYAETQSSAMDMFLSDDGGLSFASISLNDNSKGRAYIFEGNILLGQKGIISAYHQNTGAGFSTSSTINQQGKKSTGMALTYNYNTMLNLSLRHDIQEIISNTNAIATAQLGATKSTTSIIQIGGQKGKITYTGEYRRQQVQTPLTGISTEANRPQQLFAVQLDYKISEQYSAFLKQQGVISGTGENMTSLGVKAQINDKTSIQLAHTIAEESNATSVDVGYSPYNWLQLTGNVARTDHRLQSMSNDLISLGATGNVYDKLQLRTTYALQKSGDGISRNGVSVGSSYQVSPETMLTVDRAWLSGSGEKSISNIYGLSGKINERLAGNISYEDGLVLRLDGTTSNRKAGSIGFTFVNDNDGDGENDFTASGKAEMRKDNSATGTAKHILLLGTLQGRINQNTTVFAKASIANAELPDQDTFEADYREYVLGVAYRPEFSDKLNLLSRYTYLKDNSPSSQSDYTELEEEKGHVFALEAIYDFSPKLQLMEKFAYRLGEEKTAGFDFTKSQTSLWINRLQYNFNDNWSIATEYRILQQKQADDSKMGALMEVIRKIGEDFNVGLGYNFTDFNDNLTHLDYTVKGPFVRFTGVFTDKYFKPRAKVRRYQSNTKTDKKKIEIAGNQSIVSTNKNIDENKQIFKDIEAVDNKIIMMLTAELDKKKPKKKSLWQTLVSAGNYVKNNELDKASTQYLRAIELSKKSGDKLITAEIYKQLGLVFQAKGDNRQSLIAFRIALVTFEKKLGGDNPAVAEVLSFIAFGYGKSGHDYLARASLRHSIRIMTMNYGENDPRVGACVNRLAWLHCYQGDYKKGFKSFRKAMMIFENANNINGVEYASCLKGLMRIATLLEETEVVLELENRIASVNIKTDDKILTH